MTLTMQKAMTGKKSIWGIGKTKVTLYQRVRTLEEVKKLEKNTYPLVIALLRAEYDLPGLGGLDSNLVAMIQANYKPLFSKTNLSTVYMILDFEKLENAFFNHSIYIDRILSIYGNEMNVCKIWPYVQGMDSIAVEVTSERKFFTTSKERETILFSNLCKEAISSFEKEKRSQKILTQEEIEEIHKRGHLTPIEKVAEWESLDLCAPGDHGSGAKGRCLQFANCHECLLDYAYEKEEHQSVYDHLKNISSCIDEDGTESSFEKSVIKKIGSIH